MTKKVTHRDWLNYAINVQKSPISNLQSPNCPLIQQSPVKPAARKTARTGSQPSRRRIFTLTLYVVAV